MPRKRNSAPKPEPVTETINLREVTGSEKDEILEVVAEDWLVDESSSGTVRVPRTQSGVKSLQQLLLAPVNVQKSFVVRAVQMNKILTEYETWLQENSRT